MIYLDLIWTDFFFACCFLAKHTLVEEWGLYFSCKRHKFMAIPPLTMLKWSYHYILYLKVRKFSVFDNGLLLILGVTSKPPLPTLIKWNSSMSLTITHLNKYTNVERCVQTNKKWIIYFRNIFHKMTNESTTVLCFCL